MKDEHDRKMDESVERLHHARDEIDKTITFLEEVRRVEQVIERRRAAAERKQ